jgi:hypothetical protein
MQTSQIRAHDYRAKARDATALAEASVLQRVRERHQLAASVWTELAETEERRAQSLSQRFGRAALASQTRASADMEIVETACAESREPQFAAGHSIV